MFTPLSNNWTDTMLDPLDGFAVPVMVKPAGEIISGMVDPDVGEVILIVGVASAAVAANNTVGIDAAETNRRRKVFMSGVVRDYFAPLRVRGSALAGVTMVGF